METFLYIVLIGKNNLPQIEIFRWTDDLVKFVKKEFKPEDRDKLIPAGDIKEYSVVKLRDMSVVIGYKNL